MIRKLVATGIIIVLIGAVLFGLIQLVPYGRAHTNPPVVEEAPWPNGEARVLAQRACYDCHSNETKWLWYSNIAPFSWLVQRDVDEGRAVLNFSEWGRGEQEIGEAAEVIEEGEMPPVQYILLHPEAVLSQAEQQLLIAALNQMGGGAERDDDDDD